MKVEIIRLKEEKIKILRYKVVVSEGDYTLARDWKFTLWGARRAAKQMVYEINNPKEDEIVESYDVS